MPPAAFCSCKPGLRSEVGPGNGNPSPEVWVSFQEQVRDRPGCLEVSRGATCVGESRALVIRRETKGRPFTDLTTRRDDTD
jgi:hypothetical protein